MKKILLSLVLSCFAAYAMGQGALLQGPNYRPASKEAMDAYKPHHNTAPHNKAAGWTNVYNNRVEATQTGFETYNWFFSTIFQDSTVKTLYGDGNGGTVLNSVSAHGVGEIFDPSAQIYNSPLNRFYDYTIDSVYLPYFYNYVPEKDTLSPDSMAHDTLIFQWYTGKSGGLTGVNILTTPPTTAYTAKYKFSTNLGTLSLNTEKYILSVADSQNRTVTNAIQVPVKGASGNLGIKVAGGDIFGFTVSYRAGFKYKKGDTIDEQAVPLPKHLHSHFRYFIGNSSTKDHPSDFEESLLIPSDVRYNKNANGWNGQYIPGFAWTNYNQILWSLFRASTDKEPNLGIEPSSLDKGYGLGEMYPNPARGNANFTFSIPKAENVTIKVYDLVGHEVATVANGNYARGTYNMNIDTRSYKTGLYLYSITAGSYSKTLKFTVAE